MCHEKLILCAAELTITQKPKGRLYNPRVYQFRINANYLCALETVTNAVLRKPLVQLRNCSVGTVARIIYKLITELPDDPVYILKADFDRVDHLLNVSFLEDKG
jgi:hypothetical protein